MRCRYEGTSKLGYRELLFHDGFLQFCLFSQLQKDVAASQMSVVSSVSRLFSMAPLAIEK